MELNKKIRSLEQYHKALGDVSFTVAIKGPSITVKLGRKYNICRCPDKESAEILTESLTAVVKSNREKINQILSLLSDRCEQLKLQLFPKEAENGENETEKIIEKEE
jgi:hypothetical protein